ncbi:MAG: hypothetical protein LBS36_03090 [Oscillospiraceae bacterium]|jgi:hypothetical protein|nr:hypothetical protein [Oscillospiraceae bacterium]
MKKVYVVLIFIIIAYTVYLTACSSTESGMLKSESVTSYTSGISKNSNSYDFNETEYHVVNEYLSNFTQTGYMRTSAFELANATDASLLKIALLHCIVSQPESIEPGSYWLGKSNQRMKADILGNAVFNLFRTKIKNQTIENLYYEEGYYYWNTANVQTAAGSFALITKIEIMANNQYSVTFNLYNTRDEEQPTVNSKYYNYSNDDAIREFPRGTINNLSAIIKDSNLSDTDEMQLIYMQKNAEPTSSAP